MNRNRLICIIFIFNQYFNLYSQEKGNLFVREIEIKTFDSVIVATVLISGEKIKPNKEANYYWYENSKIHSNKSGIAGLPLHGPYKVFDKNGNLITAGEFVYGLKNGIWQYWYMTGTLRKTENYKSGKLSGTPIIYDSRGEKVKKEEKTFRFNLFNKKNIVATDTLSSQKNDTKKNSVDSVDLSESVKKDSTNNNKRRKRIKRE